MSTGKVSLKIAKSIVFSDSQKESLRVFLPYCVRALELNDSYTGHLVDQREKYGIKSTAVSNFGEKSFHVYAKGRAFPDILRSIAHELAHFRQGEAGEVQTDRLHFSSEYEDDANAFAGQMLNAFSEVMGYEKIFERKR